MPISDRGRLLWDAAFESARPLMVPSNMDPHALGHWKGNGYVTAITIMAPSAIAARATSIAGRITALSSKAAASTVRRLAQDIAVNPMAPRALPLNRPVARSATHNAFVQTRIGDLQRRGAPDLRVNQQQVDINGARVGVNRPDLQYTLNGQRYYEEFDIPSSTRGPAHAERILANDASGIINLFTVP